MIVSHFVAFALVLFITCPPALLGPKDGANLSLTDLDRKVG
jgi:hypothetical protein